MTQQNAAKCPTCGSENKENRRGPSNWGDLLRCGNPWHREPAAPLAEHDKSGQDQ